MIKAEFEPNRIVSYKSNIFRNCNRIYLTIDQKNNLVYRGDAGSYSKFHVHDLDGNELYSFRTSGTTCTNTICIIEENVLAVIDLQMLPPPSFLFRITCSLFTTQGDFITKIMSIFPLHYPCGLDSNSCAYSTNTNTLYASMLGLVFASSDEKIKKFPLYYMDSGKCCEFSDIRCIALGHKSTELIFSANNGLYVYDLIENTFRIKLQVDYNIEKFVMLNHDIFCGAGAYSLVLIDSLTSKNVFISRKENTQQGKPLKLCDIAVHISSTNSSRMFVSYSQNTMHIFEIDQLLENYSF